MRIADFHRIARARYLLIGSCGAAALLGGWTATRVLSPAYESRAQILMNLGDAANLPNDKLPQKMIDQYVGTQIRLAVSQNVASRMVDGLGWLNDPTVAQQFPGLEGNELRSFLADRLLASLSAQIDPDTGTLSLGFRSSDPEIARNSAELYRTAFLDETLAQRIGQSQRMVDKLLQQLVEAGQKLRAAEGRRTSYAKQKGLALTPNQQSTYEFSEVALLMRRSSLQLGAKTHVPSTARTSGDNLARVDAYIATLNDQLGPNNPTLISLKRRRAILGEIAAGTSSAGLGVNQPLLEQKVTQRRSQLLANMEDMNTLEQLNREVDAASQRYKKLYALMLGRADETQLTETRFRAIGNATQGIRVFPRLTVALIGSLGFGLVIGVEIAVLLEVLRRRVRVGSELVEVTDIPVMGEFTSKRRGNGGIGRLRSSLLRFMRRRSAAEPVSA